MKRSSIFVISFLTILLLAGAAYFTLGKSGNINSYLPQPNKTENPSGGVSQPSENTGDAGTADTSGQGSTMASDSTQDAPAGTGDGESRQDIANTRDIPVDNNTLEFELKASLFENKLKQTFLRFEYYKDGSTAAKEFDDIQIPEIKDMFESSGSQQGGGPVYGIENIYLNGKTGKAYLFFKGDKAAASSIYSFGLEDSSLKKIFSEKGEFTALSFAKDNAYAAFSFTAGLAPQSAYLEVIKCDDDSLAVNKNRRAAGRVIGQPKDGLDYNYAFSAWYSNRILKLKETVRDSVDKSTGAQREILYDIEKNVFLNLDGSPATNNAGTPGKDAQVPAESEPVKVLRNFYTCLSTGQYDKAYGLLDEKFSLNIFKQFGLDELSKADINVNEFSQYGVFFQAAKIKNVVGEKTSEDVSTVYFYQLITLEQGDQIQPLVVTLKKTAEGWKIASVVDGKADEEPFKSGQ